MSTINPLIIRIMSFICLIIIVKGDPRSCENLAKKIDYHMKVSSLATKTPVVIGEDGIDDYCNSIEMMITGIKQYRKKRCSNPVTLVSLGVALMRMNQFNRRTCFTERDTTQDVLECLSEHHLKSISQCWANYSGAIQTAVIPAVPDMQMFSMMCCSHRLLIDCLHQHIPDQCPGSKVNARRLILDMLNKLGAEFFSMACFQYTNQYCQASGEYDRLNRMHFEPTDESEFLFIPIMNFTSKLIVNPFE